MVDVSAAKRAAAMNHTEACIALNMIPQMGPVRLRVMNREHADEISRSAFEGHRMYRAHAGPS